MGQPEALHLFQAFGIELEYMIVDRDTLQVRPITDALLRHVAGRITSDVENGMVTWSNELVLHVVELKSTRPEHDLAALEIAFVENILRINKILEGSNAMLLPSAAHPFMDPAVETRLWPHDSNEVYEVYNRIFDCRGHGWSNLQSTHLNLPFQGDDEFEKLHAAIRLVLPLLPALCASSPLLGGVMSGVQDTRMLYYKTNQAAVPSITGKVIPEAVFSRQAYEQVIYAPIEKDIAAFDPDHILEPLWVNSRGAIARFDRGSIEIRIMDIQECAAADLAIVTLVFETLKAFVDGVFTDLAHQKEMDTDVLAAILDQTVTTGPAVVIEDMNYLACFNQREAMPAKALWRYIISKLESRDNALAKWRAELDTILEYGTLAHRITRAIGSDVSRARISKVYRALSDCLATNKMFIPER